MLDDQLGSLLGDLKKKDTTASRESKSSTELPVSSKEINQNLNPGGKPSTSVETGSSSSWTKILIQKSLDKVERGEATLEEVARERFGSLNDFEEAARSVGIPLSRKPSRPVEKRPSEPAILEDRNKLMAQKLKAEMMGDIELARQIEVKLKRQPMPSNNANPGSAQSEPFRPKRLNNNGRQEDDGSIFKLLEHEKLAPTTEFDDELARKIAKTSRYSDRPEDVEDFSDRFDQPGRKKDRKEADIEETRRRIAMGNYHKMARIQENCWFCLDSTRSDPSLIIAQGHYSYLALSKYGMLDPFHCLIVPMEHAQSSLYCDEGVWDEIRNFKKCYLKMAAAQGRQAVFLEASMEFNKCPHCFIDCVALPASLDIDPQVYYRKALQECDVEWSQHKRVLDTTVEGSGGLRRAVPRNFPFIYVDFRLDQGFAHVVEDEELVPPSFLRSLTAKLLGLGSDWRRLRAPEDARDKFIQAYDPFDWTKLLHSS